MSASTRDRRATVYPYVGRNEGGYATSAYGTARGTYWCRFSPVPGAEAILDAQVGIDARATIEFSDEVPVAEHDLIVIDSVQWKAGPITPRRAQRALLLQVSRSNEMVELLTGQTAPAAPTETFNESGHTDTAYNRPDDSSIDSGGADAVFTGAIDAGGA